MKNLSWYGDNFVMRAPDNCCDDFHYEATKDLYQKNSNVRIIEFARDTENFVQVFYEFLVDVEDGRKVVDEKVREEVKSEIKKSILNCVY